MSTDVSTDHGTHGVRIPPTLEEKAILGGIREATFGQAAPSTVVDTDRPDQYNADVLDHLVASWLAYDSAGNLPQGYQWFGDSTYYGRLVRPDGHTIFAFRGTKDLSDVKTDINLVLGRDDGRYRDALEYVDRYMAGKDRRSYSVAGHSLGGSIATYVGSQRGLAGHVFNPAPTPQSIANRTNIEAHINVIDPISLPADLTRYKKTHYYKSPKGNPIGQLVPSVLVPGQLVILGDRARRAHSISSFVRSKDKAINILDGKNITRFPRIPDLFI